MTAMAVSPRAWDPPDLSPRAVLLLLLPIAAALGALVSYDPKLGIGGYAALLFVIVVFFSFPLALGGLVVLIFVSGLPGLFGVPAASTAVVGLAWLTILPTRHAQLSALRAGAPLVLLAPWLLFAWMIVTTVWAPDIGLARMHLWQVFTAIVAVPIVAIGAHRIRTVQIVVATNVLGGAMIVLLAIVLGSSSYANGDPSNGRLEVTNFSANLLGATAVASLILVPAVYRMARGRASRVAVVGLGALLMYGVVATQSRSGFIALAVAAVAALVLCQGRRRAVAIGIGGALIAFALFVAIQPGILHRTETGDSTGRSDIWKAAVAVWKDHPVGGAGVGNFQAVSPSYSLRLGPLEAPEFITVTPMPPHNLVLEALAETGLVGFALLLLAVGACLVATGQAARIFTRAGNADLALLAQLILVAQIAMITAGFFLPITTNRQLWILLAVGAALLGIARRTQSHTTSTARRPLLPRQRTSSPTHLPSL